VLTAETETGARKKRAKRGANMGGWGKRRDIEGENQKKMRQKYPKKYILMKVLKKKKEKEKTTPEMGETVRSYIFFRRKEGHDQRREGENTIFKRSPWRNREKEQGELKSSGRRALKAANKRTEERE